MRPETCEDCINYSYTGFGSNHRQTAASRTAVVPGLIVRMVGGGGREGEEEETRRGRRLRDVFSTGLWVLTLIPV